MDRVIVWGMGKDFWGLYNLLHLHEVAGDFEIVAYVDSNMQGFKVGGKVVCSPYNTDVRGG